MTHSRKYGLFFATGIGCIALGYSLWMFANMNNPERISIILPAALAAPVGAFIVAALCWFLFIETMHFHGKLGGIIIGIMSAWSIFASGLLAAFATDILFDGFSLQTFEAAFYIAQLIFGIGPLYLLMAWGWIPGLLCVLWGALLIPFYCSQQPKEKPEK